jgi:nitroreductase
MAPKFVTRFEKPFEINLGPPPLGRGMTPGRQMPASGVEQLIADARPREYMDPAAIEALVRAADVAAQPRLAPPVAPRPMPAEQPQRGGPAPRGLDERSLGQLNDWMGGPEQATQALRDLVAKRSTPPPPPMEFPSMPSRAPMPTEQPAGSMDPRAAAILAQVAQAKRAAVMNQGFGSFPVGGWLGSAVRQERAGLGTDPIRAGANSIDPRILQTLLGRGGR